MEQANWSGTCKALSDDTVSTVPTEKAIINEHVEQKGTDRQAADIGKDLRELGGINQKRKFKGAWTPGWEGSTSN